MNEPDYNDLCERCKEYYQYRDGLCWNCYEGMQEERAEELREREVLERLERREAND